MKKSLIKIKGNISPEPDASERKRQKARREIHVDVGLKMIDDPHFFCVSPFRGQNDQLEVADSRYECASGFLAVPGNTCTQHAASLTRDNTLKVSQATASLTLIFSECGTFANKLRENCFLLFSHTEQSGGPSVTLLRCSLFF